MSNSTITIYRITHERYQEDPFSGKDGLDYRSRWASQGQLVSYATDHLATATLEKIAGVKRPDLLSRMVYVEAEVDTTHVDMLSEDDWPDGWDALPAADVSRAVGDTWLEAGENLLLRIPAVVLPNSYNYLINPAYPAAAELTIRKISPLLLDNRVLRHLGVVGS